MQERHHLLRLRKRVVGRDHHVFCSRIVVLTTSLKVGTHEGTSRRDLFQGLVRCRVYTMGQVAGTSPLKALHAETCYTSK